MGRCARHYVFVVERVAPCQICTVPVSATSESTARALAKRAGCAMIAALRLVYSILEWGCRTSRADPRRHRIEPVMIVHPHHAEFEPRRHTLGPWHQKDNHPIRRLVIPPAAIAARPLHSPRSKTAATWCTSDVSSDTPTSSTSHRSDMRLTCNLCLPSGLLVKELATPAVRHLLLVPDFLSRPKAADAKSGLAIERTWIDAR